MRAAQSAIYAPAASAMRNTVPISTLTVRPVFCPNNRTFAIRAFSHHSIRPLSRLIAGSSLSLTICAAIFAMITAAPVIRQTSISKL